MSIPQGFRRVSKSQRCSICGRPDWCLSSVDDPPSRAICARVSLGSHRKLTDRDGSDVGYLHVLRGEGRGVFPRPNTRTIPLTGGIDFGKMSAEYQIAVDERELTRLASGLGVSTDSLNRLGIGWSYRHRAWSFPMSDCDGHVRGIRLRNPSGRKLSVNGGREGLFLPMDLGPDDGRLLICEGPTDAAALIDLGFAVVGRPNCSGGSALLIQLVQKRRQSDVVVFADVDPPGRLGAENLASILVAYAQTVRIVEPPSGVKDARAWKLAGATRAEVCAAIDATEPRHLQITTSIVRRRTSR